MPKDESPVINPKPVIEVTWDAEKQDVGVKFKPNEFKSWTMVVAALDAALSEAKFHLNMSRMEAVQQKALAMMQEAAIRSKLQNQTIH